MPPDPTMRDALQTLFERRVRDLTGQLVRGDITLLHWHTTMRAELRQGFALELISGAGGEKSQVAANDWLRLGSDLRSQYGYLEDFARAMKAGDLSEEQMLARAELYARSMPLSYWRQVTRGASLPAQPRDGSSPCLGNCGCGWEQVDGEWYWVRGKADSCEVCQWREAHWNPYVSEEVAA